MRMIRHALTEAVYDWADDGVGPIRVIDRAGREGRFDANGRWVQGDVRAADPELCRWISSGGPTAAGPGSQSRRFDTQEVIA